MATVTSFTAARSQAIEDANIVSAAVDGSGDLILTRHDGGTINAGSVIGPEGPEGPTGPAGTTVPSGTLIQGNWDGDPPGYLICAGYTILGGALTYPDVAAAWPSWVNGNDLEVPDLDNTFLMGSDSAPGGTGGANTRILTTDQLPSHAHSLQAHTHGRGSFDVDIDHDHPSVNTSTGGEHSHDFVTLPNFDDFAPDSAPRSKATGTGYTESTKSAGNHAHSVNIPNYNVANRQVNGTSGPPSTSDTGSAGNNQGFDNRPQYFTVRTAVKI